MQGVEIEKKYRVIKLPEDIEKYKKIEIEQSYLNHGSKPTLRLRKYNEDEYILSYKARKNEYKDDLSICDEVELPLSKESYEHLRNKIDGRTIYKTRYVIPLDGGLKVEIDKFKGFFDGVCFAEIEFKSEEQANSYKIPDWLGEDISNQKRVKNGYMAILAQDIGEYKDLLL
jgi:CYTH domain-containing protein